MKHALTIAGIAVRELLYEKAFYLLLSFAALSLGLSLIFGQMTYAEQAKLTLDFMLGGTELSMILFSVFMGISLFQRELTMGSIAMVLSKPISRSSFIFGKFLGQFGVQCILTVGMGLITLAFCSRFDTFISSRAVMQTTMLIALEVGVLTSITYLFSVNAGGITAAVATLCFFCLGSFRTTLKENLEVTDTVLSWEIVKNLVPDFEIFNMKHLASYGQSIPWIDFGWAFLYAACCSTMYLIFAALCFQRKDIPT